MAAKGQCDRKASDMEVCMKQRCVTELLHAETKCTHRHPPMLAESGDQTATVGTVRGGWCISALVTVVASSGAGFVMCSMHLLFTAGENAQLMVVPMLKSSVLLLRTCFIQ